MQSVQCEDVHSDMIRWLNECHKRNQLEPVIKKEDEESTNGERINLKASI